jgi:hypothetical protein
LLVVKEALMKNALLIILTSLCAVAKAQFFFMVPVFDIQYSSVVDGHHRLMIRDSSIYAIRDGCLQIRNAINGRDDYRMKNHFPLKVLLPDGSGKYIFLSNANYIGKFDTLTNDYAIINTDTFAGSVRDIGISPNGNIWATANSQIGIYSNNNWNIYQAPANGPLTVIDDTSAFVTINTNTIALYHNGTTDTLFHLPTNTHFRDWDTDSLGNVWIAGESKLIYLHDTTAIYFDSTNTPSGSDNFRKVVVGKNGHVWTCGERGKLLEFDGTTWITHALQNPNIMIDNFNLDSLSNPWVIAGYSYNGKYSGMTLYIGNGSNFNTSGFPFNPFRNAKAVSSKNVAINQGLFEFNSFNVSYSVNGFYGQPNFPFAEEVSCIQTTDMFVTNAVQMSGTSHGTFDPHAVSMSLDSFALPNDTINCLFTNNGTHYVCTNNGLLIYDGIFNNVLNTSNSPLPSNKITFATILTGSTNNTLYIGTDKGVAIVINNQWTVYDSAFIGSGNFYVTGISPPRDFDTTTYVSTMGNGLIEFYPSGSFQIYNTTNGTLLDDSLYYVMWAPLAKCGDFIIFGTSSHGLGFKDILGSTINYCNTTTGYPIHSSRSAAYNFFYGYDYVIATDAGLYFATGCNGIAEQKSFGSTNIYPNPANGIFTIDHAINSGIEIYNLVGELIYETQSHQSKTVIDFQDKPKGMYFIKTKDLDNSVTINKIIIQ